MARPRKAANAHLPRHIHEKHGGFYYVRHGKWVKLGNNIADAFMAMAKRLEVVDVKTSISMPDLLDLAFPAITVNVKESTITGYRSKKNKLKEVTANKTARQLKPVDVYAMRRALEKHPSTFNCMLTVLNKTMQWAVEKAYVETNPCAGIKPLEGNTRDRYVEDDEYARLQAAATDERIKIVMELCYRTGQRINDVRLFRLSQIVERGVMVRQGKTDNKVLLLWTPELRAVVDRAKAYQFARDSKVQRNDDDPFLLQGRGGAPVSYSIIRGLWLAVCAAAKVSGAWIHDLRAKAATDVDAVEGGEAGEARAQGLMGHGERRTTRRYLRKKRVRLAVGPTAGAV